MIKNRYLGELTARNGLTPLVTFIENIRVHSFFIRTMVLRDKTPNFTKNKNPNSQKIAGSYFGLKIRTTVKQEPLTLNKPKLAEKTQIGQSKPK